MTINAPLAPGLRKASFRDYKPLSLRITWLAAILYAAGTTVITLYSAINTLIGAVIPISMPIELSFPHLGKGVQVDGPTAHVSYGSINTANVAVSGLGMDARIWLALGQLLEGAAITAVAVMMIILTSRLLNGSPFVASVPRVVRWTATIILITGLLWQVALEVGGAIASREVLQVTGASWRDDIRGLNPYSPGWPKPGGNFTLDFWPIFVALGLYAFAAAFRYGILLQRDRVALKRDTEGLV